MTEMEDKLMHLANRVLKASGETPNDQELGKRVRQIIKHTFSDTKKNTKSK